MGLFEFIGLSTLGYPDYRDTGTGKMLVADPGESYGIAAIDGAAAVPPPDGRWETAAWMQGHGADGRWEAQPPPVPEVPAVPEVPQVEGSDV